MQLKEIEELNEKFANKSPVELIRFFSELYGDKIALSTSLGAEDQVLTHMVMEGAPGMDIFTLDTGRLFPETYDLIARTRAKYNKDIDVYFPERADVEAMVKASGINLFYDSIENRKMCCGVRKLDPLKRAFVCLDAWVCGLRASQAVTRSEAKLVEWDVVNEVIKINPLVHWSEDMVWDYIKANKVPYNTLHDKGFPSIGCQPCTRAVLAGEDVRAGRWYWENPETKECGLHKR